MGTSIDAIIVVKQEVFDYLDELTEILFLENYFRFEESAEKIVQTETQPGLFIFKKKQIDILSSTLKTVILWRIMDM